MKGERALVPNEMGEVDVEVDMGGASDNFWTGITGFAIFWGGGLDFVLLRTALKGLWKCIPLRK